MERKAIHWVMDYETLCNCFVGVFTHYLDETERKVFAVCELQTDFKELVEFLNTCVKSNQWHISYNGLNFDAQISQYILLNQKRLMKLSGPEVAAELYKFAQDTISRTSNQGFAEYPPHKLKIRQIDLFRLNHWDNTAKRSSLKWIQYSMDWSNVEEMPHHHSKPVTTREELDKVISYCVNDVLSTKEILKYSKEQIALRQSLTKEYNIDLYSASEPKISKELFLHFLHQRLGWDKAYIKQLRTKRDYIILAECILPYIQFRTPEFQKVLDYFRTKVITSTKDGFKYSVNYRGVKTDFGLGGIHGATDPGVYEAKKGWTIMTSDVTSFYPNLAIKNGFSPEHLPKEEFCSLYEWIFEERRKIPKSDPKNYVFKIILNSTYGLTADENSFLYDPKMTMQITINGQLSLSMLYEMLCLEIPEAIPLMQNTDGLEMMIPEHKIDRYKEICAEWEKMTQLQLEHDQYQKMIIADVNNYIAVSQNGKTKCKGRFEWEDLAKKKVSVFHKNKSFLIIPKAIYAYFIDGITPEDFLANNQDIHDYCAGVKAKQDWTILNVQVSEDGTELTRTPLQKIVRYYISNTGGKLVKKHVDNREIQIEAGRWKQQVVNKINPRIPFSHYDINTKYYLDAIYREIETITEVHPRYSVQLSLF
jgi:hypothetical protein